MQPCVTQTHRISHANSNERQEEGGSGFPSLRSHCRSTGKQMHPIGLA